MAHYTEAMRLAPADPEPHFLAAQAYYARGDTAKAIEHFRTALRLDPEHVKALRHLARLLAANENAGIRNGAESLRLAERAVERTGGQPLALDVLGMAYAELGRFEEAAATAQEAIDRLNAAGEQAQAREVQSRLELYRSSRPFREPVTNAVPTL
jgi:tetratricopeptide (TPR) repeat protein